MVWRTRPRTSRSSRFVGGGDTAGQGFGINPDDGGMRIYEAMRLARPDFFVHCGDTVYADAPIPPEKPVTTPERSFKSVFSLVGLTLTKSK